DVDSLDTSISVGTGTPVADGLSQENAEKLISAFTKMPNFRALEITEVNPLLDTENKMATTVVKILRESFAL
ncbi:MAG: arginase, partial [Pedobacter sp.]